MKSELQWLTTNISPDIIRDRPATVKDKSGEIIKALLKVEEKGDGLIAVSAHYDRSPFPDMPRPAKFYMTQAELEEYLGNAKRCILNPP